MNHGFQLLSLLFAGVLFFVPFRAFGEDVNLLIGFSLPPYVISKNNSGIELDIVKESLAESNRVLKPRYVPFKRVTWDLSTCTENPDCYSWGNVDGALTITESSGVKNVHYSDSHITYQNVAVTIKSNNYQINKLSDLANHKIVAFQNATKYLGPEYARISKSSTEYKEVAKQALQIKMLFKNRTDIVVMDINIFKYFRNQVKNVDTSPEVTIHEIFPPTPYKVAFADENIRDDFNRGLANLRAKGRVREIFNRYLDQ